MADKKITELDELNATPADDDMLAIVDVSETPDTTKKISASNLLSGASGGISYCATLFADNFYDSASAAERYTQSITGGGSIAFGSSGIDMRTAASAGHSAIKMYCAGSVAIFDGKRVFTTQLSNTALGTTTYKAFSFVGEYSYSSELLVLTGKHYGFITSKASGTSVLNATQADGSTETSSSLGATINPQNALIAFKDGTSSVKYYLDDTLSATLTTNIPTGSSNVPFSCGVGNENTSDDGDCQVSYWSLNAIQ